MPDHYIHNVMLCDPESLLCEQGSLLVKDGKIAAMGSDVAAPDAKIPQTDGKGCYLIPGLVDMRAQLCSPGAEHKESIETGIQAACRGGVTSMVTWPSHDSLIDGVAEIEFIARRGRECKGTKLYCYAALTKGLQGKDLTEFGLLHAAGALGFTDGAYALDDPLVMHRALTYAAGMDILIVQHPEMRALTQEGQMNQGALATLLGLKGMPAIAEVMQVERDLRLLSVTGGKYHIAHISSKETVEAVRRAKRNGLNVSCDTAPQYFLLNELAVHDYRTFAKVNPPLRSEEDRLAIIEALADGTIDAIVSDHLPQDQDSKRLPFELAEFGMVGLETLLALSLKLVHNEEMDLLKLLQKLTSNPAKRLGIDAGRLEIGQSADMVLLDLEKAWMITEEGLCSKSKNTSFDKMPVQGAVLKCWIDGRMVGDYE